MLWKKYEMLETSSVIAPGVQRYKFEADWMSSFHDMTYYDSINTGGSCLSCTAVKPDSHLAWIFMLPKILA